MITLPVTLGWFILITVILVFAASFFGTWASHSHERKQIKRCELEVEVSKGILNKRMEIQERQATMLTKLSAEIMQQQKRLDEERFEIGRQAHDTYTLVNATMHQVEDATEIMDLKWEDEQYGQG